MAQALDHPTSMSRTEKWTYLLIALFLSSLLAVLTVLAYEQIPHGG